MVDVILDTLDVWYNEPSQGSDRPKLLSKLAALELCGWIEGEFDRIVSGADAVILRDATWVREEILERNFGFTYSEHLRAMLSKMIGEVHMRKVEQHMEQVYPGELDRLRSMLGMLWKLRCTFAHADVAAHIAEQQRFDAPSWSKNQYRLAKRFIDHFETSLHSVIATM